MKHDKCILCYMLESDRQIIPSDFKVALPPGDGLSSLPSYSGDDGKSWEIKELRGLHHTIIRLHCSGMGNKDIADQLGITPQTVSNTINSQIGKQQIAIMQASLDASFIETQRHLNELAPLAVLALGSLIIDKDEPGAVKVRAAKEVLDRTGHSGVQKHLHAHVTSDEIAAIKERALATGQIVRDEDVEDIDDV